MALCLVSCGRAPEDDAAKVFHLSAADIALSTALEERDFAAAERALRSGANPNANSALGTVLKKAVVSKDPALVELLLKAGANPNLCPPDTSCPMTIALHATNYESNPADEAAARDAIATLLLRAGADPNGSPNDSSSPLQYAIKNGSTQIAILLLDVGARPEGRAPNDHTLGTALKRGDHVVVQRLLAAGVKLDFDPHRLEEIASNGDAESLRVALDLTRQPGERSSYDLPNALAAATIKDCAECVRLLFEAGAVYYPYGQYSSRTTTWFELIGGASSAVLEMYAAHGLDPQAVDANNITLLHLAAKSGKVDSVKWLVSRGVPVDAQQKDSLRTPLMVASEHGQIEAVKALLDAGADAGRHDARGKTPKVIAGQVDRRTVTHDEAVRLDQVVRLLRTRGALEYAGEQLPLSKYDAEVAGKDHHDVTAGFYSQLPFLRAGLRFFSVYAGPPRRKNRDDEARPITMPNTSPAPVGMLYAVLPDRSVLKLTRPDDIRSLGIQVRSADDALRLVRVYTDLSKVYESSFRAQFATPQYWENLEDNGCVEVNGWAGLGPVVVPEQLAGAVQYVVTRYVFPLAKIPSWGGEMKLDGIIRTTERVQVDGAYSLQTEVIKVPGLRLQNDCSVM